MLYGSSNIKAEHWQFTTGKAIILELGGGLFVVFIKKLPWKLSIWWGEAGGAAGARKQGKQVEPP